jgi:hypothetical protein
MGMACSMHQKKKYKQKFVCNTWREDLVMERRKLLKQILVKQYIKFKFICHRNQPKALSSKMTNLWIPQK